MTILGLARMRGVAPSTQRGTVITPITTSGFGLQRKRCASSDNRQRALPERFAQP
jgi:hypothetical protein